MARDIVAKNIRTYITQLNKLAPRRSRRSDGTIGDAAHASRKSDHNPWFRSTVTAVDITHDPENGMSCDTLAAALVANRDARLKYVIWNRRIFSKRSGRWAWRSYSGSNPHTSHLHLSVQPNDSVNDARPWDLAKIENELRYGRQSAPVANLQRQLNALTRTGVLEASVLDEDGDFGPATDVAVRQFQRQSNLTVDGFAGTLTMKTLSAAVAGLGHQTQPNLPIVTPGVETVEEQARRAHNETLDAAIERQNSVLGGTTSLAAVIANWDAAVELIRRDIAELKTLINRQKGV